MKTPAGYCAHCGHEIAAWQFNGPVANDLTTQGAEMHSSCCQAEARRIVALGDEPRAVQEQFGKHLQWDSLAVVSLLAQGATQFAQAMAASDINGAWKADRDQHGYNRRSACGNRGK